MTATQHWFRRMRYGKPIVVVSGLPRSGTSMAMKMLDAAGIEIVSDGIRKADEDNPKGYYELERIKNLADEPDKSWLHEARGKAVKIISYLLKELPPSYNYDVIFMRRNIHEVVSSQNKMLTHRGEATETEDQKMVELFENDLWRAGYLLKHSPQFRTLEIDYGKVLQDPREQAAKIAAFLGKGLPVDRMAEIVDGNLYRNRR